MTIAVGKPEELGKALVKINAKSLIGDLTKPDFNGYICVTISGKTGVEEGLMFFKKGRLKISNYEYFKYNTKYIKKEGLERCLNSLIAKTGVVDKFSATEEQTKLIETLKEEEVFADDTKIKLPNEFSYQYEDEEIKKHIKEKGVSREDILRRFGITSLRSTEASKEGLMIRAKTEDADIQKLVKDI